ncbi:chemotaxis protein CheW [Virgibacillus flavescens]|uniref:chemotaxis protein CheW n=1 Tax=Virgibacillus flavescens TaxID=1611422 RepID=UPI003D352E51
MEEQMKVIVFQLKDQQYGVGIEHVRSIERVADVTSVPGTSDFIKGVINLRGDITPIVDLKERLQIGVTEFTEDTRVLIVEVNNVQVGLIVDSASDVLDIDPTVVEDAPRIIGGVNEAFIKGVAKLENRLLILLDFECVLNLDEINEVQAVAEK